MFILQKKMSKNASNKTKNFFIYFLGPTRIDLTPTYFYSQQKIKKNQESCSFIGNLFVGLIFFFNFRNFSYFDF